MNKTLSIFTLLMAWPALSSAHLDEAVHVHADAGYGIFAAIVFLALAAIVFVLRRMKRQTMRR